VRSPAAAPPLPALLLAAAVGGWLAAPGPPRPAPTGAAGGGSPAALAVLARPGARARVTAVLDGDTVRVRPVGATAPEATVRYLGADAPESVHPREPVGCFGPAAARRNRAWVLGRVVVLRFDRERVDRYGRVLAAVRPVGWRRTTSERLVAEGAARTLVIAPNGADAPRLRALEARARAARRGLWGACPDALRSRR
jgi:micrococcal nuclease